MAGKFYELKLVDPTGTVRETWVLRNDLDVPELGELCDSYNSEKESDMIVESGKTKKNKSRET